MASELHALDLPAPDRHALKHSQKLIAYIRDIIHRAGGKISFAEYMQHALYAPELGYYVSGTQKLGAGGDFVTAPEISPLFSRCLANQCHSIFAQLPKQQILEFGAGTGKMATDILLELERLDALPEQYYIIEVSAQLQKRQQQTLSEKAPHLLDRVSWLTGLPENFIGIVLANEVLDAMPVEQFLMTDTGILQRFVIANPQGFAYADLPIENIRLKEQLSSFQQNDGIDFKKSYRSEVNLSIAPWLTDLAGTMKQGVLFFIDYGCDRKQLYDRARHQGTLRCFYQQRIHTDVFWHPGLQDITAHVDFTSVAEAGVDNELSILGYCNQASFLASNGLLELVAKPSSERQRFNWQQQIKQLMLPSEMGDIFKVIALGKNFDEILPTMKPQSLLAYL